jgi:hypothetical protein
MEDKELKLFSQLEELKQVKNAEEDSFGKQIKDMHAVLDGRSQVINDL